MIKVKNNKLEADVWAGQQIEPGVYYTLEDAEVTKWQTSDKVVQDITSGDLIVNDGENDILTPAAAIHHLNDIDITSKDSEGSLIVRSKQAPTGWHYQAHSIEFASSKLNSDFCFDENMQSYGFTSIKLFDVNGVEITDQPTADANCVETHLDWEPTYDYEILSGKLYFKDTTLNEPVRIWVIGAPDIPKASGGTKVFANGLNLDYLDAFQPIETDGRVSKFMKYDPVYHTNKFRFIVRHNPGKKIDLMFVLELFKA